jgi:SDR family mycofactocin-dependent oxidoreductase
MGGDGTLTGRRRRVALVTGAARGIGAATVRRLAAEGYTVVAVDHCGGDDPAVTGVRYPLATVDELEAVAADVDGVVPVVADVRDRAAIVAAAHGAVERFGRLDAVVAGAAVIAGGRPLWESPPDELWTLWDVDVGGVVNTAAACIPLMLDGPDPSGCRFVAVASVAGSRGLFHLAGYTMAKHAVVGLVRGLAADLIGTGMTAVTVSPGATRTPLLAETARLYGVALEELAEPQLIGRLLEPDEVARVIAWCCDPATAALNGADIAADGGFAH